MLSEGSSSRETVDAAAHPAADGLALGMRLLGADPKARAEPLGRLPGEVNYFVGERRDWRTGIPTHERIRYRRSLARDRRRLLRKPRPARVRLPPRPGRRPEPDRAALRRPGRARVAGNGDLVLRSAAGAVHQRARSPTRAWTAVASPSSRPTSCTASAPSASRLGAYDTSRPLVIDPLLMTYSTFIGGSGDDFGRALAVDSSGAAYLFGEAETGYPTTPGAFDTTHNGGSDAFVTKLNPAGTALVYSTFLGGTEHRPRASGSRSTADGSAYVTGETTDVATDFPTTGGRLRHRRHNGSRRRLRDQARPRRHRARLLDLPRRHGRRLRPRHRGRRGRQRLRHRRTADASTDFPTTAGAFDTTYNGGHRRLRDQAQPRRHRARLLDLPRRRGQRRRGRHRGRRRGQRLRHGRHELRDRLPDHRRRRSTRTYNGGSATPS